MISDITVSYNDGKGLERTLNSLYKQNESNFEVIVVDGGSTDNTIDVLKKYEKMFKARGILFWSCSEKDEGIYNAMNKGIKRATGEWLIFMNAGDCVANENVFSELIKIATADSEILYGDWLMQKGKSTTLRKAIPFSKMRKKMVTRHQAYIVRSQLLKERPYNEKYRIIADYEWMLNAQQNGKKAQYIPMPICICDMNGVSNTNFYGAFREGIAIRNEYNVNDNNILTENAKAMIAKLHDVLMKCFGIDISFLWN